MIAEPSSRRSTFAADACWPASGRSAWICGQEARRASPGAPRARARTRCRPSSRAAARARAPSAPNAAMNCVPLTSDRPSFASSATGSSPTRGERLAAGQQLARRPTPRPRRRAAARGARAARGRRSRRPSRGSARAGGRRGSGTRAAARRSRRARPSSPSRACSRAAASPRARPRPDTARRRRTRGCAAAGAGAPRVSSSGIDCETKRPKPVLTPYVCSRAPCAARSTTLARGAHLLARLVRRARPAAPPTATAQTSLDVEVVARQRRCVSITAASLAPAPRPRHPGGEAAPTRTVRPSLRHPRRAYAETVRVSVP